MQEGIPEDYDVVYVGSLSVDVDIMEQEVGHYSSTAVAASVATGLLSAAVTEIEQSRELACEQTSVPHEYQLDADWSRPARTPSTVVVLG